MQKLFTRSFALTLIVALFIVPALLSQTGTQHGVQVTWNAPSPVGGSGTIAGYNIYRCTGTCTATSGTWSKIDTSLDISTGYLDPSSDLVANTAYPYAASTVDTHGNESGFSNVATVTTPAAFPTNPNPPGGCNSANQ